MDDTVQIAFGPLSPPIRDQIKKQDLQVPWALCQVWEGNREAINNLRIAGLISDNEARKATVALRNLHYDLGTMKWTGADEGWELAIKAVRADILKRVVARSATTGSGATRNAGQ